MAGLQGSPAFGCFKGFFYLTNWKIIISMRRFTSIFGTFILVLLILFLVACQTGPQAQRPSIEVVTATPGSTATITPSEEAEEEPVEEPKEADEAEEANEANEAKEAKEANEANEAEEPEEPEAPEEPETPDPDSSAYPAPLADNSYPAPSPTEEPSNTSIDPSKPLDVPAPTDSTKANIGGTLLQQTTQGLQPFEGAVLYLGHLVLDDSGEKSAAGFFEKSSPRTSSNSAGHFLFENVEPREYVLFFWTPQGSVMLLEPSTGEDMIFDLKAGDAINTGPLDYDLTY